MAAQGKYYRLYAQNFEMEQARVSFKNACSKHPVTIAALAWLIALYIRLVYFTSRKIRHIHPDAEPCHVRGDDNCIYAFWHGRMMMMLAFRPAHCRMHVLSTPHRDGQLSSRIVRIFGNYTIYGSSTRGGHSAAREMLRVLKDGDNISITPEGPARPGAGRAERHDGDCGNYRENRLYR